jgi:hypothetical protein
MSNAVAPNKAQDAYLGIPHEIQTDTGARRFGRARRLRGSGGRSRQGCTAMNALIVFSILLGLHWIADFVLQTNWQARNKSKRLDALGAHVGTYTAVIAAASVVLFGLAGLWFALINGALHFVTDFFTSKLSARFAAKPDWRLFAVIGFDQLIHQWTFAVLLALMFYH